MITQKFIKAMLNKFYQLPLPDLKARVCCLGCGKNMLVPIAHEGKTIVEIQVHALQHAPELSEDVRARALPRQGVPTNDLVISITSGRPSRYIRAEAIFEPEHLYPRLSL